MTKYAYQIKGALENANGKFCGFRVLVGNSEFVDFADVPAEVFTSEIRTFIEFRLKLTERIDIRALPATVQTSIRTPLGRWLDYWVMKNFGDPCKPKDINA